MRELLGVVADWIGLMFEWMKLILGIVVAAVVVVWVLALLLATVLGVPVVCEGMPFGPSTC